MKTIVVLCGGGIRGYTESEFCRLMKLDANLYAGTSIGGLIACARANGKSWEDISDLFLKHRKKIFKKSFGYKAKLLYRNNRYNNKGLYNAVNDFFGDTTMNQLKPVCVTAMDITAENYGPHFFSEKSTGKVTDACMATSAAPSYFRPYQGFIDGGIFMNNPVLYAVLKAQEMWPKSDLKVINIGSGKSPRETGEAKNGLDIINDVISHSLNGSEMAGKEIMQRFDIVKEYEYHEFHYSRPVNLDDTDEESFKIMRKSAHEAYARATKHRKL